MITERERKRERLSIAFARKRTQRIFRARFSPHRIEGGTYVDGRSPEVLRETKKRARVGGVGGGRTAAPAIRGSLEAVYYCL